MTWRLLGIVAGGMLLSRGEWVGVAAGSVLIVTALGSGETPQGIALRTLSMLWSSEVES